MPSTLNLTTVSDEPNSNGHSKTNDDDQAGQPADEKVQPDPPRPDKGASRRWTRRVFRTVAVLVVAGGVALGGYLAWPTINERYIQPVETTAADLTTVHQQLDDAETRINNLETETETAAALAAEHQTLLDEHALTLADITGRVVDIETQITDHTTRLDDLDDLAATLETELETASSAAADQIHVMRATELMARARLFLYQANYGLATTDLTEARDALASLTTTQDTASVIDRLDLAIANLPDRPLLAADDLDIAWQILLNPSTPEQTTPDVAESPQDN